MTTKKHKNAIQVQSDEIFLTRGIKQFQDTEIGYYRECKQY